MPPVLRLGFGMRPGVMCDEKKNREHIRRTRSEFGWRLHSSNARRSCAVRHFSAPSHAAVGSARPWSYVCESFFRQFPISLVTRAALDSRRRRKSDHAPR